MNKSNHMQMSDDRHAHQNVFIRESSCKEKWEGEIPHIGIKRLDKMRPHANVKSTKGRRFWPGTKALCKIHW